MPEKWLKEFSESEVSTHFILAQSGGDELGGAGRKLGRLGDGIHFTASSGGRRAAAVGCLQGPALLFGILGRTRTQSSSSLSYSFNSKDFPLWMTS